MDLKGWLKGLITPEPTVVKDDLWAVWRYDSFPYAICAQVEEFTPEGRVRAKGYRGYTFKPETILHGARGKAFNHYLRAARTAHATIVEAGANAMRDRLGEAFKEFGVPIHVRGKDGFRMPAVADMMDAEIAKILANEAPAWSYGDDAKPLDKDAPDA